MKLFNSLGGSQDSLDRKAQRTADRRRAEAARIAGRVLPKINGGEYAFKVRSGWLNVGNTFPELEVYDLVAKRLLEEDIEIKVHSIQRDSPLDGVILPDVLIAHAFSVATIKGWPKYLALNPVNDPGAFEASGVASSLPYNVRQIYPPPALTD